MTGYEQTTVRRTVDGTVEPVLDQTPGGGTSIRPLAMRTTTYDRRTVSHASTMTVVRRGVTLGFGIAQALIVLRIALLLLAANHGNDIVGSILGVTNPLVEPFRGMFSLGRIATDSGSVLDIAAIVALIGWTLVEALVLAILGVIGRDESIA